MISIYSPQLSPRLTYVVDLIFSQVLQLDFKLIDCIDEIEGFAISYSEQKLKEDIYHIQPNGLLFETDVKENGN